MKGRVSDLKSTCSLQVEAGWGCTSSQELHPSIPHGWQEPHVLGPSSPAFPGTSAESELVQQEPDLAPVWDEWCWAGLPCCATTLAPGLYHLLCELRAVLRLGLNSLLSPSIFPSFLWSSTVADPLQIHRCKKNVRLNNRDILL